MDSTNKPKKDKVLFLIPVGIFTLLIMAVVWFWQVSEANSAYAHLEEDYKTLQTEQQITEDDYNRLKEECDEWINASEEDKEAWRNLDDQEKAELAAAKEKREQEEKEKELAKQRILTEGVTVYDDEKVTINYLKADASGVTFLVENKTDIELTIQADSVALNGISTDDIMMSDDVAPQSKGEVHAQCSIEGYENVNTVSGQLRVIDFNHSFDSYNAKFINVEVGAK